MFISSYMSASQNYVMALLDKNMGLFRNYYWGGGGMILGEGSTQF